MAKFKGNERAIKAVEELEQNGSEVALEKVKKYLDLEMVEEKAFATAVQQIAQQIINIQNQNLTQTNREYINYGRDQINIERVERIDRLGGS